MLGSLRAGVTKSVSRVTAVQSTAAERTFASVSLKEDVPGLPATTVSKAASTKVNLSVLSNGIKVASREDGGAVSSVTFRVNAGSRYEQTYGAASFLEHLAFRRTQKRTSAKLGYDVLSSGAQVSAKASREAITYSTVALRDALGDAVGTLAEVITQPMLRYWEVNEEKSLYSGKLASLCAESAAVEELHTAAFGRGTPLGHGSIPSASQLYNLNDATLRAHLSANYTAGSIVVSGVNVDHDKLVDLVNAHLAGVPKTAAPSAPASGYEGGYSELRKDGDAVRISVAFPTGGLTSASAANVAVLAALLGFGPDLYANNLANAALSKAENAFATSLKACWIPYSDVGLLSVTGTASAKDAERLLNLIAGLTKSAAGASSDALASASLKASLLYAAAAANRDCASSMIAQQVAAGGSDLESVISKLKAAKPEDVKVTAKDVFGKPVSIAAVGNTTFVPSYNKASKLFA